MEDPRAQVKDAPYVKVLLTEEQKVAVRVVAAMRGMSQSDLVANERVEDIVAEYRVSFPDGAEAEPAA
jgi:hypothetical protein